MRAHRRQIPLILAAALFCLPSLPAATEWKGGAGGAREVVERGFADFTAARREASADGGKGAGSPAAVIAEVFDLGLFSARILAERWPQFSEREREEFRRALSVDLARYVDDFLEEKGGEGTPVLTYEAELTSGFLPSGQGVASYLRQERVLSATRPGLTARALDYVMLRYSLGGPGPATPLYFVLAAYPGGSWKVTEIFSSGKGLVDLYQRQVRETLQVYSLPYLLAELSGSGEVVLEDWSGGREGGLPPGWRWREEDGGREKPYAVREEGGVRYLAAEDRGESVPLGKEVRWDPKKYPLLSFRWRARDLPAGGDESRGPANDSAAGLTVVFDLQLGLVPQSIKYVWSSTLPVGAAVRREGIGKPWVIVAESGPEHLGEWRSYTFNVYEAYRRTFGGEPPRATVGIGILTDANATGSSASADYGPITALRGGSAGAGTGIATFLAHP